MGPSFVALDFELANASHASIDSCGVVRVDGGRVGEPRHWYCRPAPPYDFMGAAQMRLTGIRPSDLADARPFAWLGPHLVRNIADAIVVGHNVQSDLSMLEQSWVVNGLGLPPSWRYVCTARMAKALIPDGPHKLDVMVERVLGEPMVGHHRADADAHATARLALALLQKSGTTLEDWVVLRSAKNAVRPKPPNKRRGWRPIP